VLNTRAGEIGHFNGGVMNIREYIMPDSGVYTAIYNIFYTTDQLNDSNGDRINSVTIKPGPGPGIQRRINVDIKCTPWYRRLSGSLTLSRPE
jgi:hypothetical protein